MPKRKLVAAILAVALGAALGGALVTAAPWTDTQTTSGNVTVTTTQDELYICDASGNDPPPPPEAPIAAQQNCGRDDSGADETILQTDEALTPNSSASWVFRLVNIGTADWDVTGGATPAITETADPGADCTDQPLVSLSNIDAGGGHVPGTEPFPVSPVISGEVVHVIAGNSVRMNITASLPSSLPAECQGNAWDIVLQFDVSTH